MWIQIDDNFVVDAIDFGQDGDYIWITSSRLVQGFESAYSESYDIEYSCEKEAREVFNDMKARIVSGAQGIYKLKKPSAQKIEEKYQREKQKEAEEFEKHALRETIDHLNIYTDRILQVKNKQFKIMRLYYTVPKVFRFQREKIWAVEMSNNIRLFSFFQSSKTRIFLDDKKRYHVIDGHKDPEILIYKGAFGVEDFASYYLKTWKRRSEDWGQDINLPSYLERIQDFKMSTSIRNSLD